MSLISFKPKQVSKKVLSPLNERARDIICNRFGLTDDASWKTLEAIGEEYGITRERVRQIENAALNTIKKSDSFKEQADIFKELKELVYSLGAIVLEEKLLALISKEKDIQNHIHFYLVLGSDFVNHKEDNTFKTRWSVDDDITKKVHEVLEKIHGEIKDNDIVSEKDMIEKFLGYAEGLSTEHKKDEIVKRWLELSKIISTNPLGEWGNTDSSNIKTRGIKDFAYLVMRKHGSPMHFKEVANAITEMFKKKAHLATCHNELIKDPRFVLVGRGVYALSDWGYRGGVVKNVIQDILKKEGPLSKEDVIEKVLKERYLQKNTILVNLQNKKYFKKNKAGLYTIA